MAKENKTLNQKQLIEKLQSVRKIIDECVEIISGAPIQQTKSRSRKSAEAYKGARNAEIDFALNERNFIKTYVKGLSGPKKFVLLLACIVKGKIGEDVSLPIIRTKWNKMTSKNLMGYEFNLYYPNQAKTQGWVDSKKNGTYHLRNSWTEIFS